MTKLSKNHPFILSARKLEILEANEGISPELIKRRFLLKKRFPEYFKEYMKAKVSRQQGKKQEEYVEKKRQMKARGCETVSYYKKRKEEQKKENYQKKHRKV